MFLMEGNVYLFTSAKAQDTPKKEAYIWYLEMMAKIFKILPRNSRKPKDSGEHMI